MEDGASMCPTDISVSRIPVLVSVELQVCNVSLTPAEQDMQPNKVLSTSIINHQS